MSDFARAARAMQAGNIRHFGGGATCVLRRRHSVKQNGSSMVKTFAAAAALAGATSLTISATGAKGTMLAGIEFTIAGHGAPYTTTADATATSGALALAITPALTDDVALDAVVTISRDYVAETYALSRARLERIDQEGAVVGDDEILDLEATDTSREPRNGDIVVMSGVRTRQVISVRTVDPGGGAGRYVVTVGEAAS